MRNILFLSAVLICFIGYGQKNPFTPIIGSRVIIEKNNSIKGEAFLYDQWNRGMLVLNDSVFSKQDYLQFDAYKDRILIKNIRNSDEVIEINDPSLTGFSIRDGNRNIKHDFVRLGKGHFKNNGKEGFYEIVFNIINTNYFIKKNVVFLYDPNRSKGSQSINNYPLEYRKKNEFFIKDDNGLYVRVMLNKKDIRAVLNKHTKEIDAYVKGKKIRYKKESDIAKLVNFYYSL